MDLPAHGYYILTWFTKPPDTSGIFREIVYNVSVKGRGAHRPAARPGNNSPQCAGRNANMLPSGTRWPTIAAVSQKLSVACQRGAELILRYFSATGPGRRNLLTTNVRKYRL
jgi:hypothetical protein